MYNYNRLIEEMKKQGYKQSDIAKAIKIDLSSFNLKLNNHRDFTQTEIYNIMKLLKLKEIEDYFFTT